MNAHVYRYEFGPDVANDDIEVAIVMAIMAAESLYGEAEVRLNARYFFDAERHACVIDVATELGASFNKLFMGFLSRECGPDSFKVHPLAERKAAA
ncbi:hypothetical protein ETAA8_40000 [Anatilimnocola aggregata]|uniref:Uncharacterized protein n=1 Tax=Anatilimnocola aggregata TaxID=2528021 RepID=A0A517YF91_9BACT|nr:hypothetical protein [Anatilimnocola aggregata]QDU28894.1 hypothetical protein ETAA8_40000 [Anatilimnocola aggregata]